MKKDDEQGREGQSGKQQSLLGGKAAGTLRKNHLYSEVKTAKFVFCEVSQGIKEASKQGGSCLPTIAALY